MNHWILNFLFVWLQVKVRLPWLSETWQQFPHLIQSAGKTQSDFPALRCSLMSANCLPFTELAILRCVRLTCWSLFVVVVAFSLCVGNLGECLTNYSPPALFFLKLEISLHTLIPLFTPGLVHSGSARWDDCHRVFPDELCVSSFPDRFPHYVRTRA